MAKRTCTVGECEEPTYAKAMCRRHYRADYRRTSGRDRRSEYHDRTCVTCSASFRSSRRDGKFCSDACKGLHYSLTRVTRCKLPAEHPVVVLMREARKVKPKPAKPEWRTPRECPGCGGVFCPLYTPNTIHCSRRCLKRVERRKRRLSDSRLGWVWSEFMRIAQRFDFCCAYCGTKPARLDPDHVVPLSKGGADSATNLLPACPMCNSSKSAMSLVEWAKWRETRGLPKVKTEWDVSDARYHHLTHVLLTSPAA